jgi:hypothetical protein
LATRPERAPDQMYKNGGEAPVNQGPPLLNFVRCVLFQRTGILSLPSKYLFFFDSIRSAFGPLDLTITKERHPEGLLVTATKN